MYNFKFYLETIINNDLKDNNKQYIQQSLSDKFYHICYVGKFNPFHKAHYSVYQYLLNLLKKYNLKGKVYICTQLKDTPFSTAEQKKKILELSGIPSNNIINYSGYNIYGLLNAIGGNKNDVLVTAFSQKDLDDESKSSFLKIPKDNIISWHIIRNIEHLPYLRPVGFIHKRYQSDEETKIKKEKKGTAYVIIVPTQKIDNMIISSSLIREHINNKNFDIIKDMVVNDKVFKYLKQIYSDK